MPDPKELLDICIDALEELKARDISILDVGEISSEMDTLLIASGNSSRQVKALADNVAVKAKEFGVSPSGIEGADLAEWILVDLGDIIVHIMTPATREFYDLEGLWKIHNEKEKSTTPTEPGDH